jgi:hypothetical protein
MQDTFCGCGSRSCNLLFEKQNFDLGDILLSCLVSKIQKPPSAGFETIPLFSEF